MDRFGGATFLDAGESASRSTQFRMLLPCTAKGVQAADEMLRIANNLQRG
ncbi:MAG TPA: hypothetical protein VIW73_08480 [Candidatus Cybelea sp.]